MSTLAVASSSQLLFSSRPPAEAWSALFAHAQKLATNAQSPLILHQSLVSVDRLLSDSAWDLWQAYSTSAPKAAQSLIEWSLQPSATGRAVLILDALSLRELRVLLAAASARGIAPVSCTVLGAEAPTETDQFAQALGVSSRSAIRNDKKPAGFRPFAADCFTDVLSHPFEDCLTVIPHTPRLVIWHTWLDDLLHKSNTTHEQVTKAAETTLQSTGFWSFLDRLRQGRRLLITADHGYGVSRLFAQEERDEDAVAALREVFGASRCAKASVPWTLPLMPPYVATINGHHVIVGQRKWKVPGAPTHLAHGGLSLLEAAVPFIELPPLA
jgi:hypothetical protein